MRPRYLRLFPFLVLPLVAFKCGHGYPMIENMLDRPVALIVQYRSGQLTEFELRPGTKAIAPPDAIGVDEIEVRSDGEILFHVEKEELDRLVSNLPPDATRVVWEIQKEGVKPKVYSPQP